MKSARFEFDWNPTNAASNLAKRGVSFDEAMTVFLDHSALSRLDDAHASGEERWVTIGLSRATDWLCLCTLISNSTKTMFISASSPHASPRRTRDGSMSNRPSKAKDAMKDEYDFAHAKRGKFYRENAVLIPPVHLEPEVLNYLQARAEARGTSLSQLVNQLLKKDIELIETVR